MTENDAVVTIINKLTTTQPIEPTLSPDNPPLSIIAKRVEALTKVPISENSINQIKSFLIDTLHYKQCTISKHLFHPSNLVEFLNGIYINRWYPRFRCVQCRRHFFNGNDQIGETLPERCVDLDGPIDCIDGSVCTTCFANDYVFCDHCNLGVHSADAQHSGTGESLCENCYDPPSNTGEIQEISFNVVLPPKPNNTKERLAVGWEIEYYPHKSAKRPTREHINRIYEDGSLNENGMELTTQPALPHQWEHRLQAISTALVEGDLDETCGGHLHVDARYLYDLIYTVTYNRHVIDKVRAFINQFDSAGFTREYPEFATFEAMFNAKRSATSDIIKRGLSYVLAVFQNCLLPLVDSHRINTQINPSANSGYCKRIKSGMFPESGKYNAINCAGLTFESERQTVEFRLWHATLDIETLKRRAEVCEAMVRYLAQLALLFHENLAQATAISDKFASDNDSHYLDVVDCLPMLSERMRLLKKVAEICGLDNFWLQWANQHSKKLHGF